MLYYYTRTFSSSCGWLIIKITQLTRPLTMTQLNCYSDLRYLNTQISSHRIQLQIGSSKFRAIFGRKSGLPGSGATPSLIRKHHWGGNYESMKYWLHRSFHKMPVNELEIYPRIYELALRLLEIDINFPFRHVRGLRRLRSESARSLSIFVTPVCPRFIKSSMLHCRHAASSETYLLATSSDLSGSHTLFLE